jgi:hypothetical protein
MAGLRDPAEIVKGTADSDARGRQFGESVTQVDDGEAGAQLDQAVAVGGIGPLDEELPDHPGTDPEGLQDRGLGRTLGGTGHPGLARLVLRGHRVTGQPVRMKRTLSTQDAVRSAGGTTSPWA